MGYCVCALDNRLDQRTVWQRETNYGADKIILTKDAGAVFSGKGPPESPRVESPTIPGDYNNDQKVNFADLMEVILGYNTTYAFPDLMAVILNYGYGVTQ